MVGVTGNKLIPAFVVLILISVFIFLLSKFSLLNFAQNSVEKIFAPVQYTIRKLVFRPSMTSLQNENLDLSKKLVDQKKLEEDNIALRDQFETSSIKTQNLLSANIVGSPAETLILDKGSKDGVVKADAVVYKDNLIGVVSKVNDNFCVVTLVSSNSFATTAISLNNSSLGTVKGQGAGQIVFDNVVLSQKLSKNEIVVTKGSLGEFGNGLLPNLVLGKIISIDKNPSSLFQSAKIQPLVDSFELSTVFVILNK